MLIEWYRCLTAWEFPSWGLLFSLPLPCCLFSFLPFGVLGELVLSPNYIIADMETFVKQYNLFLSKREDFFVSFIWAYFEPYSIVCGLVIMIMGYW